MMTKTTMLINYSFQKFPYSSMMHIKTMLITHSQGECVCRYGEKHRIYVVRQAYKYL